MAEDLQCRGLRPSQITFTARRPDRLMPPNVSESDAVSAPDLITPHYTSHTYINTGWFCGIRTRGRDNAVGSKTSPVTAPRKCCLIVTWCNEKVKDTCNLKRVSYCFFKFEIEKTNIDTRGRLTDLYYLRAMLWCLCSKQISKKTCKMLFDLFVYSKCNLQLLCSLNATIGFDFCDIYIFLSISYINGFFF